MNTLLLHRRNPRGGDVPVQRSQLQVTWVLKSAPDWGAPAMPAQTARCEACRDQSVSLLSECDCSHVWSQELHKVTCWELPRVTGAANTGLSHCRDGYSKEHFPK